jgi:hypothetical protein
MRATRVHVWRDFRSATGMRQVRPTASSLRAEARLLTTAGLILLAIGFPVTLFLVSQSLSPDGMSPVLPLAIGAPPIVLGYVACHFASARMAKAKALEGARRSPVKRVVRGSEAA